VSLSKSVVLIVEDEPFLRMHAACLIEEAGFATLEAGDADDAIRLLETHPDIKMVFSDINLPGSMDSIRLSAAIRKRWPPVKLVLTSGKFRAGDSELPSGMPFLAKPYDPGHLVRVLRGQL